MLIRYSIAEIGDTFNENKIIFIYFMFSSAMANPSISMDI